MDSRRSQDTTVMNVGRVDTLRQYSFLDPACETGLLELARLAVQMTGLPLAAIALSENGSLWFKAVVGFDARRLDQGIDLCRHVVAHGETLVVNDASRDSTFSDTRGVTSYPQIQFFAGVPLRNAKGQTIGCLFVGDREPRRLTPKHIEILEVLARQAVTQLELARKIHEIQHAESSLHVAERTLRQQNKLLHLQQQVASTANEATSALAAMQAGLTLVCQHTGWPVGHCYRLAEDGQDDLVSAGAWHLSEPDRYAEFRRITESLRYAAGAGLSGKVLASGQPLCVDNVSAHEEFRRAGIAQMAGLNSGSFFPMMFAGKTVGIMEFFTHKPTLPNDHLQAVLIYIANQLGQVIGRERAERNTRASEQRFRALFENSPDAVFVEDLNGNVLDVNPAACRLHKATRQQLVGKNVADLVPESHRETVAAEFSRLARLEIDYVEGVSLTTTDEVVPVEIRVGQIVYGGQSALLLHVRDVSERKRLEQQFLQIQRTEAIGRLAGGVAHDFNNILTVITGYSEMLLLRPGLPESIRRSLDEIGKAGFRGANLTRQLLAFSRNQVLQPQVLDLNAVVTDISKMLQRLIGEHIELVSNLQPELSHVKADPAQLEQVLMNLVINARDAMPDGGSLVISTADVEVGHAAARRLGGLTPGRYVTLTVTDTGCGMNAEVLSHIFEPFFTTKPVGKGTGLGLATCFGIIKQSGGHIAVSSQEGRGSKFRIYLPRGVEEATTTTRVTSNPLPDNVMPVGTETVLLVEDEEVVRALAAETLREYGYTVLEAGGGEEALKLVEQPAGAAVDLILTDIVMPQISGRELVDKLIAKLGQVCVLFTSGYTEDYLMPGMMRQPGVGFLEKPYTGKALARKVREVLDAHRESGAI